MRDLKITKKETAFGEFSAEWFRTYVTTNNKPSEQRAKNYILTRHLVPAFGKMKLGEITVQVIERYKASRLASGLSHKTVNNHLTVLRRCLQCAVDWGHLATMPRVQWLRREPREIRYLNDEEYLRLLIDNHEPQWNLMVKTALFTGMRVGELLALDWSDVDFNLGVIVVRRAAWRGKISSPKSNRIRRIPIAEELAVNLWPHRQSSGLLFGYDGQRMCSYDAADRALARICKRTGVRGDIGWHTLRHTFATHLVARGAVMRAVQELMGHATITMTERYAHVLPSSLRGAVALLGAKSENIGHTLGKAWPRQPNLIEVSTR